MAGIAMVDIVCTLRLIADGRNAEVARFTVRADNANQDQSVIDGMMLVAEGLPGVVGTLLAQAVDVRVAPDFTTLRVEKMEPTVYTNK